MKTRLLLSICAGLILFLNSCKKDRANQDKPGLITISHISSDSGYYGKHVMISGTNLLLADSVKINSVPVTIETLNDTVIEIIIPRAAGSGSISIISGQTVTTGPYFNFTFTSYVTTIGGTGVNGSDNGDGIAIHATFGEPSGLVVDSVGNVYTIEGESPCRIRKITPDGLISFFSGSGNNGFVNGPAAVASYQALIGIAMDKSQNFYVTDFYSNSIRKVTPDGSAYAFAGTGVHGLVNGPADSAEFNGVAGLCVDPFQNVYVTDGNSLIRKISYNGMVTTIAGNGQRALVDGRADTASFKGITAVCLDPFGNIYVTDVTAVRKLSPDGMLTTIAGSDIAGRSDGQGAAAQFVYLQGLVSDASGNIFVIDEDKIKKMTPDGTVTTVAGSGLHGFLDGAVAEAEFAMPWGIALDKQGNIYVADWENYRIRKIVIQ